MLTLLGQKIGMTQVFAPDGATVPATIIHVPEARVISLKTVERDGYSAVQVGTRLIDDAKKAERVLRMPQRGHLKASGVSARTLFEIRVGDAKELEAFKPGAEIKLDELQPGAAIHVRGMSKGRGFAGVVKRHHFKGGPASHGHKDNLRRPGSIGAGHPQHVHLGTRMAGHMGDEKVTVKGLEVLSIDAEKRTVLVKGSVPGAMRSTVWIVPTGKMVNHPIKDRKALESTASPAKDKTGADSSKKDDKAAGGSK